MNLTRTQLDDRAAGSPVVFISYSHDSEEHKKRVLGLSERLRDDGITTLLDRYVNGAPTEGWQRWMPNQLEKANFVFVICTETYYRRFRGHELPGRGRGADWEGALITQEIYNARSNNVKYVPILFVPEDEVFIPDPLRGFPTYTLDSLVSYQRLCDFLQGADGVEARPVGALKKREPRKGTPLSFEGEDEELRGDRQSPSSPVIKQDLIPKQSLAETAPPSGDGGAESISDDAGGYEPKPQDLLHSETRLVARSDDNPVYENDLDPIIPDAKPDKWTLFTYVLIIIFFLVIFFWLVGKLG